VLTGIENTGQLIIFDVNVPSEPLVDMQLLDPPNSPSLALQQNTTNNEDANKKRVLRLLDSGGLCLLKTRKEWSLLSLARLLDWISSTLAV
jgi:hypothetical protein